MRTARSKPRPPVPPASSSRCAGSETPGDRVQAMQSLVDRLVASGVVELRSRAPRTPKRPKPWLKQRWCAAGVGADFAYAHAERAGSCTRCRRTRPVVWTRCSCRPACTPRKPRAGNAGAPGSRDKRTGIRDVLGGRCPHDRAAPYILGLLGVYTGGELGLVAPPNPAGDLVLLVSGLGRSRTVVWTKPRSCRARRLCIAGAWPVRGACGFNSRFELGVGLGRHPKLHPSRRR